MDINLGKTPFDIDFHPSDSIVASGLITGNLLIFRYGLNLLPQRLHIVHAHKESCRAVKFINEGHAVITGSGDCSLLATDVETGSEIARVEDSHSAAVTRISNLSGSIIASGDDEGCIKVWDTRRRTCCSSFDVHEEYISDISFVSASERLIGTSGDGTFSVYDLRRNKVRARSEYVDDELLSVVAMKNGRKIVCGTQTGALLSYSWGHFEDYSDKFTDLCPNSVNTLIKMDEDMIITGAENGLISLVNILPNRIVQPIAEHSDFPIERLALSHDRRFLGSISHDKMLKLWNLDELLPHSDATVRVQAHNSTDNNDDMDVNVAAAPRPPKGFVMALTGKRKNTRSGGGEDGPPSDFFADL